MSLKFFAHFNSCYDFDLSDVSNKDLGKEKASEHECSEVLADYINLSKRNYNSYNLLIHIFTSKYFRHANTHSFPFLPYSPTNYKGLM